jgi:hypothetical protein
MKSVSQLFTFAGSGYLKPYWNSEFIVSVISIKKIKLKKYLVLKSGSEHKSETLSYFRPVHILITHICQTESEQLGGMGPNSWG